MRFRDYLQLSRLDVFEAFAYDTNHEVTVYSPAMIEFIYSPAAMEFIYEKDKSCKNLVRLLNNMLIHSPTVKKLSERVHNVYELFKTLDGVVKMLVAFFLLNEFRRTDLACGDDGVGGGFLQLSQLVHDFFTEFDSLEHKYNVARAFLSAIRFPVHFPNFCLDIKSKFQSVLIQEKLSDVTDVLDGITQGLITVYTPGPFPALMSSVYQESFHKNIFFLHHEGFYDQDIHAIRAVIKMLDRVNEVLTNRMSDPEYFVGPDVQVKLPLILQYLQAAHYQVATAKESFVERAFERFEKLSKAHPKLDQPK